MKSTQGNRDRRLLYFGIVVVLFVAALAGGLPYLIFQFVNWYVGGMSHRPPHAPTVQDFGSAGEYFGLVIGVPLGLLATLIAAMASIFFAHYTLSKDEVAILSFVEELMRPMSAGIKEMVNAFVVLLRAGNNSMHLTRVIRDEVDTSSGAKTSDLMTKEQLESFQPQIQDNITAIRSALDAWTREYEVMISTMFGSLFAHEAIAAALSSEQGTANSYLRSVIPESLQDSLDLLGSTGADETSHGGRQSKQSVRDPAAYSNDVRHVLSYLSHYHVVSFDDALEWFVRAAILLPSDYTTIEFMGAAIYAPTFLLEKPLRGPRGLIIRGYMVNIGAAQLMTLYQYIPNRQCIQSALIKIFENRSKAAEQFMELAAPTARDFVSFRTDDSIRWQFRRPERMIVVFVEQPDKNWVGETYDKSRHGPIPASGYDA
jgi:hypothetical protein